MTYILPQLLSDTARKLPEKTAVACEGRSLTYAALDEESNRLAHLLRKEGVRPGDRVGLYLNKSVETVLGIFAVLKAGAAYVPIDPQAPAQRLGLILQNCGTRHLLTTGSRFSSVLAARSDLWGVECAILMDDNRSRTADAPAGIRSRYRADCQQR